MRTVEVIMPPLHSGQLVPHNSDARFRVVVAGRRWGKTRWGAQECLAVALIGGRSWWVAPSYKMARVGWRAITTLARQIPGTEIRRGDLMVRLPTGGEVSVRSADNPDSLRGEGLDLVVLDELAFMREEAWTHALRPALSDRMGRAIFISTPKGRNWFWRLWTRGNDSGDADWQSFGPYPTTDNPYIAPSEVDEARRNLPERVFRQEYLAEFVDDAGGVFRRVMDAAVAVPQERAAEGHQYAFGVDWARSNDYTVIIVVDVTLRAVVAMDRFSRVEYEYQVTRLKALHERFRPTVIMAETNAMGLPIVERLQRDGLPVSGFTTTAASKQAIIDALVLAFERGEISIIPDDTLIAELQAFEGNRLPSGHMRYSAPEGVHDDTVMALAIAWGAVSQPVKVGW